MSAATPDGLVSRVTAQQVTLSPSAGASSGTWPTALYRLYTADGTLLYVGITLRPSERFATHARDKDWWPLVARKPVEWHSCRADAMAAETRAIAAENPVHNSVRPQRVRVEYTPPASAGDDLFAVVGALRALEHAPPVEQIRLIPLLYERIRTVLVAERARALFEAEASGMARAEIAKQLGISRQQITKIAEGPKNAKESQDDAQGQ